jgi:hypothetical protein
MNLAKTLCASLVAAALLPGSAVAHDGQNGDFGGHHHRHHSGVALKGTVTSVDASNGTLAVKVAKASRGGNALEGDTVTVKAVKGWVADTNNDGSHSLADVKDGDTVLVLTKRRFIDADANTVSAAFVIDKTNSASTTADRRDGDRHFCDHS